MAGLSDAPLVPPGSHPQLSRVLTADSPSFKSPVPPASNPKRDSPSKSSPARDGMERHHEHVITYGVQGVFCLSCSITEYMVSCFTKTWAQHQLELHTNMTELWDTVSAGMRFPNVGVNESELVDMSPLCTVENLMNLQHPRWKPSLSQPHTHWWT